MTAAQMAPEVGQISAPSGVSDGAEGEPLMRFARLLVLWIAGACVGCIAPTAQAQLATPTPADADSGVEADQALPDTDGQEPSDAGSVEADVASESLASPTEPMMTTDTEPVEPTGLPSALESFGDEAGFAVISLDAGPSVDAAGEATGSAGGDEAGFATASPSSEIAADEASPWSLSGVFRSRDAVATRASGIARVARLRQSLDVRLAGSGRLGSGMLRLVGTIHAEYDFSQVLQRPDIPESSRDVYQQQVIFQENYLAYHVGVLDLAFGRQIVNWGQSEVLNLLDVINPRDLREPGLADLSDLRMAVLATRAELSLGAHRLEVLIVHEPYFGLRAPPLGTFSPMRTLLLENQGFAAALDGRDLYWTHRPEHAFGDLRATQPHARWGFSGRGYDLALQVGSVLDSLGVAGLPPANTFAHPRVGLPLYHPRYELVGHSGAATWGSFLLRWEASAEINRPLQTQRTGTPFLEFGATRRTQLNGLLGLTYLGSASQTASLELLQAYVVDSPDRQDGSDFRLLMPIEKPQLAFRGHQSWWNDRLSAQVLLLLVGVADLNSLAARAEFGYSPRDGLKLSIAYMGYHSSREFGPFFGFSRNEQLYFGLRWDFVVQ